MVYLIIASLVWAFSFGLIKGFLVGFDPLLVASGRLILASLVFMPFLGRARLRGSHLLLVLGLGALQFGLMYVLYIMSFRWLPAWLVALMTIFTPLYVVGIHDLRSRRFHRLHVLAALIAVLGAGVVLLRGLPKGADWQGIVLLQGANLCFAAGQVYYPTLKKRIAGHDLGMMAWMYQGAALFVLVITLLAGPDISGWTKKSVLVLLYLGLVPTALGFYLWNKGTVTVASGQLAVGNNLKVPLAVIVSWLFFQEPAPYLRALGGMALLVLGLWLATLQTAGRR